MVRARVGRTQLGCLTTMAVASAVVYFTVNIGEVLWKNYKYSDRMKQEARFAANRSDAVIKRRMAAYADSLGLPEAARRVHVKRGNKLVAIWADYYDIVQFPGFWKEIHFNPQASGQF